MGNNRHWSQQYIGLPYAQADCAALCVKVQKEIFNRDIALPTGRESGLRGISRQITSLQASYATPISAPEEGDAVLMVGKGRLNHIGTATFINGQLWVLHAMRSAGQAVLHNINSLENMGLIVEGYYRWR